MDINFEICKDSTFTLIINFKNVDVKKEQIEFERIIITNNDILIYHFYCGGKEIGEGDNSFTSKVYFTINNEINEIQTLYWNDDMEPTLRDIEEIINRRNLFFNTYGNSVEDKKLFIEINSTDIKFNKNFNVTPRQGGNGGVVGIKSC
jgi:hypothetical protein